MRESKVSSRRSKWSGTFAGLIEQHAEHRSEETAFVYLRDGEQDEERLTYGALRSRARAAGAALQRAGAHGERVLLLFPPGLDYIVGFLGCLYAGAVAVPAYPPDPTRMSRTLPRLAAVVQNSQARFLFTTSVVHGLKDAIVQLAPGLARLNWLQIEDARDDDKLRDPRADDDRLAMLQYTSGSTATPRAVMLTHGNLRHNSADIARCFETHAASRIVSWLPPYHDMGLIGCILQPLYVGCLGVFLSPFDFLARPLRWLQAISRYGATVSGAPNFAYDLCVRKVSAEQRDALDLRSWELAFNGAEPIHADTLDRFSEAFAPAGFRRRALLPCYGLAEATLLVAGEATRAEPSTGAFDAAALAAGRAEPSPDTAAARVCRLISCGEPTTELCIVDPDTQLRLSAAHVGELWLRGPSVAAGYWAEPELSARTFGARVAGEADTQAGWLRTGDLGFLRDGQLFVTGRLKDVLIIRGQNHYPQDLERTALATLPALRPGCTAAFAITADEQPDRRERLVLVQEVDPERCEELTAVAEQIRANVVAAHGVQLDTVVLIPPRTIPKTSSGKIQRRACKAALLAGDLPVLASSSLAYAASQASPLTAAMTSAPRAPEEEPLTTRVIERVALALERPLSAADVTTPLVRLGLDSLRSVELRADLEATLGKSIPAHWLLDEMSIDGVVQHFLDTTPSPELLAAAPGVVVADDHPLSFAQEEIWLACQLRPEASASFSLPMALELRGPLERASLTAALETIVSRHEQLRVCFPETPEGPRQRVLPHAPLAWAEVTAPAQLSAGERTAWAHEQALEEAQRPFNLGTGPLYRTLLLQLAAEHFYLLFTAHHMVADGWSVGIFSDELSRVYRAHAAHEVAELAPLPYRYVDFARWQRQRLSGERRATLFSYWQGQLTGLPERVTLLQERSSAAGSDGRGRTLRIALEPQQAAQLLERCARADVTPFMWLFACFSTLLAQASQQVDVPVGVAALGRQLAGCERLIGDFVNMLVLRTRVHGDPTFTALVRQVKQTTIDALAHQELPHELLARAGKREPGSEHPLFRFAFGVQNQPRIPLTLWGLTVVPLALDYGSARLDLTLWVSRVGDTLECVWTYAERCFDARAIDELHAHFACLLAATLAGPDVRLSALPRAAASDPSDVLERLGTRRGRARDNEAGGSP